MREICMHQVETLFGFGEFYLHANAGEQEAWNATDVGMQANVYLDFLAVYRGSNDARIPCFSRGQ
jgi:hypothetical protein